MTQKTSLFKIALLLLCCSGCTYRTESDLVDCETDHPVVTLESKTDPTGCNTHDGVISLTVTSGTPPYQFSLNGGDFQDANAFTQLDGGSFTIGVRDFNGCGHETTVSLVVASSDLAATAATEQNTECTSGNGTITVTASGSNGPFEYRLDNGSFGTDNTFVGLKQGLYNVTIKDAEDCSLSLSTTVGRGQTGISWNSEVKTIIATNCAITGCHVKGSQNPDLSVFANVKSNAGNIKSRTSSRAMPPDGRTISQTEIDKIACWVDDGATEN
ncbi:SprB repeat-containing protein [Chryseolinea lacunae]|uniref:SprB repeat-containing protein n=1 Tax=Chryseolinea lacunae TaxID=2801331 RepID=A0ABS1KLW2_9BACT|nr:SprB repeat-containing protein [Chryseolinea lacunae]MBL0740463.1 hypothetical protein [Chryseolinea lacunae]